MRINVRGKRKKVSIADYSDVVDFNKIKSNISPNLIHSLDATHLRLTLMSMVNKGVNNVWFIHDSFASHPNYTVVLNKTIRDEFIALYSRGFAGDIESQFSAQTKKALKPLPIVGDFDVKNVRFNPHFFS